MNIIKFDESINERGFFSVVLQIISIYARYPNVPFYIDLKNWNIYQEKDGDNVWEYHFEQFYNTYNTDYKITNTNTYVNYVERFSILNKMREYCKDLKIKSHIIEKIKKLDIFDGKKVLGVHRRATDTKNFPGHVKCISIDKFIDKIDMVKDNYDIIYFISDEKESIEMFRNRYKDKFYCYEDSFRSDDDKPIHTSINGCNNFKKSEDVLIESILLSKCDDLFLVDSNVGFFSIYYGDSKFNYIDNTIIK